jgi:hypothetical protein
MDHIIIKKLKTGGNPKAKKRLDIMSNHKPKTGRKRKADGTIRK